VTGHSRRTLHDCAVRCAVLALAFGSSCAVLCAQTRPATDSATSSYTAGSVQVIQRVTPGRPVIAVNLYLLGGARQQTADNAGIERMFLEVATRGSQRYPGNASHRAMLRTGSVEVVESRKDWTMIGFRGLREQFDSTWMVFADRLVHPTMDGAAMEMARAELIEDAARRRVTPDAHVRDVADSVAFAGHPYATNVNGSEQSLRAITLSALRSYGADQIVTSRMLLVVVGDLDPKRVAALIASTLGQLPHGSYAWTLPPTLTVRPPSVSVEQPSLSTAYLIGYFPGPPVTAADYLALRFALGRVASHMEYYIRQANSLSYAAFARPLENGATAGEIYVSTPVPEKVVPFVRAAVQWAQTEPVMNSELRMLTDALVADLGSNRRGTTARQADELGEMQLYRGTFKDAGGMADQLRHVTGEDLLMAARRYMKNVQFVYLGDTTKMPRRKLEKF